MGDRKIGTGESLLLGLAGLGLGLAAGFALASWTGRVSGARVRSAARRLGEPLVDAVRGEDAPPAGPGALARAVEAALAADPTLAPHGLACLPVGRRGLELHGWVPSRAVRARAARLAREVPGVEQVVNCLLVHGEDDRDPLPAETPDTAQTA